MACQYVLKMTIHVIKMRNVALLESQDLLLQIQARTHQSHDYFDHQASQTC